MSARPHATGWDGRGRNHRWLVPCGWWSCGLIVGVLVLGVAAGWFLLPETEHDAGARPSQLDVARAIGSLVAGTLTASLLAVSLPRKTLAYASLVMLLEVVWIHCGRFAVPVSCWSAVAAALWAALLVACVLAKRRWAASVTVLLGGLLTTLLVDAIQCAPTGQTCLPLLSRPCEALFADGSAHH